MINRTKWMVCALLIAQVCRSAPLHVPTSVTETPITITLIDGSERSGVLVAFDADQGVRLRDASGTASYRWEDLATCTFEPGKSDARIAPATAPRSAKDSAAQETELAGDLAAFHLNEGGRLFGRMADADEKGPVVDCGFAKGLHVSLEQLAAIQWAASGTLSRCEELFQAALKDRLPAEDTIITREEKDPKVLRGRVERLTGEGAVFQFAGKSRTVQLDRLYGLILATGTGRASTFQATLELRDGSVFSGTLRAGDGAVLQVDPSFGGTVAIPTEVVRMIRFHSERMVYISDSSIVGERTEGRLHRAWAVQRDRTVTGRPITLGGRFFEKGIGCHSLTELKLKLEGGFALFVATIGIDDSVRPQGSVVFRVMGDGKTLFDSGLITGRDAPKDIRVEVESIRELELVVDYGDGLDLADHAVWAGARLLRPSKNGSGVQ